MIIKKNTWSKSPLQSIGACAVCSSSFLCQRNCQSDCHIYWCVNDNRTDYAKSAQWWAVGQIGFLGHINVCSNVWHTHTHTLKTIANQHQTTGWYQHEQFWHSYMFQHFTHIAHWHTSYTGIYFCAYASMWLHNDYDSLGRRVNKSVIPLHNKSNVP